VKISDLYKTGKPVYSFEFFPPKTPQGAENLMRTVAELEGKLHPDFVSVTYGAGGSTRDRTLQVVSRIQNELEITAMAHLTCVASTRTELRENVAQLVSENVENILALRGDLPQDEEDYKTPPDGLDHATDLIEMLAGEFPVDIGAACYPENHLESASADEDLHYTKRKHELGAKFFVTQLFFDNAYYFDFVERARAAGIDAPIVPGIMPITNVAQIERFTKMCGASIPPELHARLTACADDPAQVMACGIEQAIDQCRGLLEGGAPGLHFYTLNKSAATRSVLSALA